MPDLQTKRPIHKESAFLLGYFFGAGERNRTLDLLITSELLYQLSYTGTVDRGVARRSEDAPAGSRGRYST